VFVFNVCVFGSDARVFVDCDSAGLLVPMRRMHVYLCLRYVRLCLMCVYLCLVSGYLSLMYVYLFRCV